MLDVFIPPTGSQPITPWTTREFNNLTNGNAAIDEQCSSFFLLQPSMQRKSIASTPDNCSVYILENGLVISRNNISGNWTIETLNLPEDVSSSIGTSHPNAARNYIEELRWLKDSLSLGMSGLAELLGVTRKTVYDWFDGVEPKRDGRLAKITALRKALEAGIDIDSLILVKHVWNFPLANGGTLRSILETGEEDAAKLQVKISGAFRELEKEIVALKQRNSRLSRNNFGYAHAEDLIRTS